MTGYHSSEDQRPITYWNGYPIYATTLLVVIHVAAFLACALLMGTGQGALLRDLSYSSAEVQSGAVWQFVTYALVHPPSGGIWFAIEMLMLWWFGRQVEQFLGRRAFLQLYLGLLLLTPVVLTLLGFLIPTEHFGSSSLHFAVFIAFAALYPGAAIFFGIAAKWIAAALVGIHSVQAFGMNDWPMLLSLWASTGAAVLFIWHARGHLTMPSFSLWKPRPKFSVVREDPIRPPRRRAVPEEDAVGSIDPLLDKIAKSGMSSLTAKERARLEEARVALIKKERR